MRNKSLAAGLALLQLAGTALAFNTAQHHAATDMAAGNLVNEPTPIDQLGSNYPDLQKFRALIVSWTGGIGGALGQAANAAGYPGNELPAESVAHVEDQDIGICEISRLLKKPVFRS